jgi:CRP/FNR family transcriptional regulator, cyclic AMP receptor protein
MKPKEKGAFQAQAFLESIGASRKVADFRRRQAIFSQGEAADSVMYIQKGRVKLTVVNESGREAVVAFSGQAIFLEKQAWRAKRHAWGRRQQFHL